MSPDDSAILDILRAARLAVELRAGCDRAAFLAGLKTQSASSTNWCCSAKRCEDYPTSFAPPIPASRGIGSSGCGIG
jgi:hypothetical protein